MSETTKKKVKSRNITESLFKDIKDVVVIDLTRKLKLNEELSTKQIKNKQVLNQIMKNKIKEEKKRLIEEKELSKIKNPVFVLRGFYEENIASPSSNGTPSSLEPNTNKKTKKTYVLAIQRGNEVKTKESSKPFKFKSNTFAKKQQLLKESKQKEEEAKLVVVKSANSQINTTLQTSTINSAFNKMLNTLTYEPLEKGINNFTGVSCFLNSALHALFPIFYSTDKKKLIIEAYKDNKSLSSLLIQLMTGKEVSKNIIEGVKDAMQNPKFFKGSKSGTSNIQCDSSEFIVHFLDKFTNLYDIMKDKMAFGYTELYFYKKTNGTNGELMNGSKQKIIMKGGKIQRGGAINLTNILSIKKFDDLKLLKSNLVNEAIRIMNRDNIYNSVIFDTNNLNIFINNITEDIFRGLFNITNKSTKDKFKDSLLNSKFEVTINGNNKKSNAHGQKSDILSFGKNIYDAMQTYLLDTSKNLRDLLPSSSPPPPPPPPPPPSRTPSNFATVKIWYNGLSNKSTITTGNTLKTEYESKNPKLTIINSDKNSFYNQLTTPLTTPNPTPTSPNPSSSTYQNSICDLPVKDIKTTLQELINNEFGRKIKEDYLEKLLEGLTSPTNYNNKRNEYQKNSSGVIIKNSKGKNIQTQSNYFKRTYFANAPDFLMINLKIYKSNSSGLTSKMTKFKLLDNLNTEIEIPVYDENNTKTLSKKIEYEFNDIIFHRGTTINGGHYVCLSKREGKWYLFDDATRTEKTETDLLKIETDKNPAFIVLKKK